MEEEEEETAPLQLEVSTEIDPDAETSTNNITLDDSTLTDSQAMALNLDKALGTKGLATVVRNVVFDANGINGKEQGKNPKLKRKRQPVIKPTNLRPPLVVTKMLSDAECEFEIVLAQDESASGPCH